jgi:MoxR-like ATPase
VRCRDYVVPEDVKAVAHAVLEHRLTLKPELWMSRVTTGTVVADVLGGVPAPSSREQT